MTFFHTGDRRHNLARRAVTALKGIVVDEGLLHGVQASIVTGDTFNCSKVPTLHSHCEQKAGEYPLAVKMNGASATLAMVATLLRSRKTDLFARCIEHRGSIVMDNLVVLPIDPKDISLRLLRSKRMVIPSGGGLPA